MINVVNNTAEDRKGSLAKRFAKAFINPLTLLFFALALVLAFAGKADSMVFTFISVIVLVYGLLRFE